jgi:hypothetical protein
MKTLQETAAEYAQDHNDVKQAYIDGYNAAKKKKKALDLGFVQGEFLQLMTLWIDYKNERKSSYTQKGVEMAYKRLLKLSNGDVQTATAIVEKSIANNYQGLFPLKDEKAVTYYNKQRQQQQGIDHMEGLARAILSGKPTL